MSKEYLEAFKNLKQELYYSPNQIPDVDKWHETIEQALQRLEAIDNAKSSEALEIFNKVDNVRLLFTSAEKSIIKQALIKAQKLEKAIEIIREKDVNFDFLCCETFSGYNSMMKYTYCYLTQEEFDLLREVLDVSSK